MAAFAGYVFLNAKMLIFDLGPLNRKESTGLPAVLIVFHETLKRSYKQKQKSNFT